MSPESIETQIYAPELFPLALNHANFEKSFRENVEGMFARLRLDTCCKGGVVERDTIEIKKLEITEEPAPDSIDGIMVIEFWEYDQSHFSDGNRRAQITFSYHLESEYLTFKCREAREDD